MKKIIYDGVDGVFFTTEELKLLQDTINSQKVLISSLEERLWVKNHHYIQTNRYKNYISIQ